MDAREAQSHDTEELVNWLTEQALIYKLKFEQLKLAALTHLREYEQRYQEQIVKSLRKKAQALGFDLITTSSTQIVS